MAKPKATTVKSLKDFEDLFRNVYIGKSADSYCRYVESLENLCNKNKESIASWLIDVIDNNDQADPVKRLTEKMKSLLENNSNNGWTSHTIDDYLSGFRKFVKSVLGVFYANTWVDMYNNDFFFCKLVAQNALFPDIEVVNKVKLCQLGTEECKKKGAYNPYASWDYMLHYRDTGLKKGTKVGDPSFQTNFPKASLYKVSDDNSYANQYIKKAIQFTIEEKYKIKLFGEGFRKFYDYEACHVWDYPNDRRYYASIPNLVLVPRGLAQLTDHNKAVKELLRYEVQQRFNFRPDGEPVVPKPAGYDKYRNYWRKLYETSPCCPFAPAVNSAGM